MNVLWVLHQLGGPIVTLVLCQFHFEKSGKFQTQGEDSHDNDVDVIGFSFCQWVADTPEEGKIRPCQLRHLVGGLFSFKRFINLAHATQLRIRMNVMKLDLSRSQFSTRRFPSSILSEKIDCFFLLYAPVVATSYLYLDSRQGPKALLRLASSRQFSCQIQIDFYLQLDCHSS